MKFLLVIFVLLLQTQFSHTSEPLRIGTDDWPPYEYQNDNTGEIVGFSTELIHNVLKQIGVEVGSIKLYPWARAEQEVQVGNIDLIYTLNPSNKRHAYLNFPEEPLDTDYATVFVLHEQIARPEVTKAADLSRLSLGVVRGYEYSPEIRSIISSSDQVIEVTDETQLFSILARGRIDSAISYHNVGRAIIDRLALTDQVVPLKLSLFSTRYYAAFSRKTVSPELVQKFSNALLAYKDSDEYIALREKYFSQKINR